MSRIVIKNARLSFPSLFKKTSFKGEGTPKYEATFLIPKDDAQIEKIKKAGEDFLIEKFGSKEKIPKGLKRTYLADGDEKEYDGYADHFAIKAKSNDRPTTINQSRGAVAEDDDLFYAGCYVNASIGFWYSEHQLGGKQLLCNLYGVQFAKDGEPFENRVDATDDFDDIDDL